MGLSGRERRILAEIEHALAAEDPELVKRVAAINSMESGKGGLFRPYRWRLQIARHLWLVVVLALILVAALLAVAVWLT
jgi:hypothetical protein